MVSRVAEDEEEDAEESPEPNPRETKRSESEKRAISFGKVRTVKYDRASFGG